LRETGRANRVAVLSRDIHTDNPKRELKLCR